MAITGIFRNMKPGIAMAFFVFSNFKKRRFALAVTIRHHSARSGSPEHLGNGTIGVRFTHGLGESAVSFTIKSQWLKAARTALIGRRHVRNEDFPALLRGDCDCDCDCDRVDD